MVQSRVTLCQTKRRAIFSAGAYPRITCGEKDWKLCLAKCYLCAQELEPSLFSGCGVRMGYNSARWRSADSANPTGRSANGSVASSRVATPRCNSSTHSVPEKRCRSMRRCVARFRRANCQRRQCRRSPRKVRRGSPAAASAASGARGAFGGVTEAYDTLG